MKIKEIMTSPVQVCAPGTNLAEAATMMWDSDCGALPVVDHDGKVVGMITDRDVCIAVATKGRPAAEITVWETTTGKVFSARPDQDVKEALHLMEKEKIRRLPVVDDDGTLLGMLSMNDLILVAEERRGRTAPALTASDLVQALKSISAHRILVGL
jgi:CBS domain-containing protein